MRVLYIAATIAVVNAVTIQVEDEELANDTINYGGAMAAAKKLMKDK